MIFGNVADTMPLAKFLLNSLAVKTANAALGKVYPDRFFKQHLLEINFPSVSERTPTLHVCAAHEPRPKPPKA